jgi:hypothetical protein
MLNILAITAQRENGKEIDAFFIVMEVSTTEELLARKVAAPV